jgi:hypothetical protein
MVADIRTPIIVPRAVSRRRTRMPGSAARRIACQASERSSIEAHISANATSTQIGVAARSERPIGSSPMRSSASAVRPMPANAPPITAPRRARRAARRRPLGASFGSSEGRRRGRRRGPGSAGLRPTLTASLTVRVAGSGWAIASSYTSVTSPVTWVQEKRSARSRAERAMHWRRSGSSARSRSASPSSTASPGGTNRPSWRERTTSR